MVKLTFYKRISNYFGISKTDIAQKMKFFIKDFFSKFEQICNFLLIW